MASSESIDTASITLGAARCRGKVAATVARETATENVGRCPRTGRTGGCGTHPIGGARGASALLAATITVGAANAGSTPCAITAIAAYTIATTALCDVVITNTAVADTCAAIAAATECIAISAVMHITAATSVLVSATIAIITAVADTCAAIIAATACIAICAATHAVAVTSVVVAANVAFTAAVFANQGDN